MEAKIRFLILGTYLLSATALAQKEAATHASFVPIEDKPDLPRVLLIGDSISMGYTIPVRKQLEAVVNVHRIPANGGPTTRGLENIEKWLGDSRWDLIHFNWGIHDLRHMTEGREQVDASQYKKNLTLLVERLRATGATLMWATTTPIPDPPLQPDRNFGSEIAYNEIASKIMSQYGIPINDLHSWIAPRFSELQKPKDLHFTQEGSAYLAEKVAQEIKKGLEYRKVFLIGNSLTWDTVPSRLDGDRQWHVDCGKPLPYIFENPKDPCVKTSFLWPKAVAARDYDIISLQVHYGSTLGEDAAVISELIKKQPKAEIVIHTGWARWEERAKEWKIEERELSVPMKHNLAYFDELIRMLRESHPDRIIRRTQAMDLLQQVEKDIAAGSAPFSDVKELYRDKVHMDLSSGRYLMHNAMRHAMRQQRSANGFSKIKPEIQSYLDGVLDRVLVDLPEGESSE